MYPKEGQEKGEERGGKEIGRGEEEAMGGGQGGGEEKREGKTRATRVLYKKPNPTLAQGALGTPLYCAQGMCMPTFMVPLRPTLSRDKGKREEKKKRRKREGREGKE